MNAPSNIPIINLPCIKAMGRFRAVVHTGHEFDEFGRIKRHGVILRETPFGRNKICLPGFNTVLTGSGTIIMVAGQGNTTPTEGDGSLVSYIGKSQTVATSSTTRNTTPDGNNEVWWRMMKRYTFGPGSMGGGSVNIAEAGIVMGIGFSSVNGSSPVSARGLLVDGGGSPTTVSVNNAVEYLDIIWEYTEWVDASATGTVNLTIDGVVTVHDYEVRPYWFDFTGASYTAAGWANAGSSSWPGWGPVGDSTYSWDEATNCFTGAITAITGNNLGSGTRGDIPIQTAAAYVTNSKQRNITFTWLPLVGNKNISVVRANMGHTSWQISYDPPIAKVNTKQLDLSFRLSMANR